MGPGTGDLVLGSQITSLPLQFFLLRTFGREAVIPLHEKFRARILGCAGVMRRGLDSQTGDMVSDCRKL